MWVVFSPSKECEHFVMISLAVWEQTGLHEKQMFSLVEWIEPLLNVCVFMHVIMCGCSWLFPVGEWQIRGERSVSQGVTVGMRWGQIRGKYFSINSFTAAISCTKKKIHVTLHTVQQTTINWRGKKQQEKDKIIQRSTGGKLFFPPRFWMGKKIIMLVLDAICLLD